MKNMRRIQSFTRREGRLTCSQTRALALLSSDYLISLSDQKHFNFHAMFSNCNPVIVEIGFGMGQSLLIQAKNHPEYNYLGFEVHRPGIGALLAGMEREKVTNIRIIADDVALIWDALPEHSLKGIQIFFPDPWPKKRHHKRRLIQADFLSKLAKKIQSGGFLHCATDWHAYAEQILQLINTSPDFQPTQFISRPETRPVTKFEQRGIKLGHAIWDIYAQTHVES
jgi:tRNA (guanine-N7-)-methyltransferase